jgi:hypothetical protein
VSEFDDGYKLGLKTAKRIILAHRGTLEKEAQTIEEELSADQKIIQEMAASGRRGPAQGKFNRLQQNISKKKMELERTLTVMSITTKIILDITETLEPNLD